MTRSKYVPVLVALALFSIPAVAQSSIKIAAFQAYLFNSKTGQLSQDVLAKGAPELGNVPSGAFASVSALVVVRVAIGPQAPVPRKAQIRLVAVESGSLPLAAKQGNTPDRIILDKTSALGPVNDQGAAYVGFWLTQTGCHAIKLKASVVGSGESISLASDLPFVCYE